MLMPDMELRIDKNALDVIRNTQLTANFDELKEELEAFVKPYENLIVSEDAIVEAKNDRAEVNRIAKKIDERRKEVKNIYTAPLKQFEDKCKELVQICGRGTSNIDEQIKAYDEKRVEEKRFLLSDYYDNLEKKHPEYMSFEQALPEKWQLKGQSLDSVKFSMETYVLRTDKEVDSILALKSEWEYSLLDLYKQKHDILDVLALHERLTDTKLRKEKDYKDLRESHEPVEIADPDWDATPEPLPFAEEYEPESMYKVTMTAWCTYPQVEAIREQFRKMGIYVEVTDTVEAKVPYSGE